MVKFLHIFHLEFTINIFPHFLYPSSIPPVDYKRLDTSSHVLSRARTFSFSDLRQSYVHLERNLWVSFRNTLGCLLVNRIARTTRTVKLWERVGFFATCICCCLPWQAGRQAGRPGFQVRKSWSFQGSTAEDIPTSSLWRSDHLPVLSSAWGRHTYKGR